MRALPLASLILVCFGFSSGAARAQSAQPAVPAERKVSIQFQDVPLREAVSRLFAGSGLECGIAPEVPDVRVRMVLQELSLDTAVRMLARGAAAQAPGLVSLREGNGYALRIQAPRPVTPVAALSPGRDFEALAAGRKVSVSLEQTPLREALKTIFQGTGVPYAVAPGVPDVRVTMLVDNMPLNKVLSVWYRLAAMQEPLLTVETLEGVYLVRLKPQDPRRARDRFVDAQGYVIEKIYLRNESVRVLCANFGWPIFRSESDLAVFPLDRPDPNHPLLRGLLSGIFRDNQLGGSGGQGGGFSGGPMAAPRGSFAGQ